MLFKAEIRPLQDALGELFNHASNISVLSLSTPCTCMIGNINTIQLALSDIQFKNKLEFAKLVQSVTGSTSSLRGGEPAV